MTQAEKASFLSKIIKTEGKCWEWAGWKRTGYGRFRSGGDIFSAHRMAYFLHTGKDPWRFCICHKCDNPGCCNPDHLFVGDHMANMKDMYFKKRNGHYVGQKHWRTSLKDHEAATIKRLLLEIQGWLANKYRVSLDTVQTISKGRSWKAIPPCRA